MPATADTPVVSIVIPTFRRNDGLTKTLDSLAKLKDSAMQGAEIVIVDNSPEGGAEETVRQFQQSSANPIIYVNEKNPGVANARNAGLAAASTSLIAFIDDDETADQNWLDGLLACHKAFGAAVVFGPVATLLPDSVETHKDYFENFFARKGPAKPQVINTFFGCGNALLDLDRIAPHLPEGASFFEKIANETGGEDDYLFNLLKRSDETFAWAADALVFEHVPASRARLGYTLRRALGYGQGPSTLHWRKSPPNIPGVLYWMAIGVAQFSVFGLQALLMWITRSPRRAFVLDKAARGLGKTLWFPPFALKFYGGDVSKRISQPKLRNSKKGQPQPEN